MNSVAPPAAAEEANGTLRPSRSRSGANRSAKRKYHESSGSGAADMNGIISMDNGSGDGSGRGANGAQDHSALSAADAEAEADAARWKRLYTGAAMDHDTLQVGHSFRS